MEVSRRTYPSDVTDEEWSFVLPYLLLLREDARQRRYALVSCLTPYVTWCARAAPGAIYRTTYRPGQPASSNGRGGAMRAGSKP